MKKAFGKNKKLALLAIALTVFILIVIYLLANKALKRPPAVLPSQTASGSLSLSSIQKSVAANDEISVKVSLDTGESKVIGTDVFLEYNPQKWSVVEIVPDNEGNFKTFMPIVSKNNSSFDWQKAVKEESSLIAFSALVFDLNNWDGRDFSSTTFNGNASPLATVKLKAKPVRKNTPEKITVRAQMGETADSNIFDMDGNDILGSAGQLTIKITAEPNCRAALDQTDQKPGLNDLLRILSKGWGKLCSDCLEDVDESGDIGLGDLMFVTSHWNEKCSISE